MQSKLYPVLSLAFVALFLFSGWAVKPPEAVSPGMITVSGEAELRVVPDEVILTLGIETADKNLETARKANDRIVNAVLKLAKEYGIPAELVQTEYINIEPRYDGRYDSIGSFVGYFVNKTVVVTLRDISKFEGFYADVLGTGVNYVHGIQFRTTQLRAHRDKARDLAIKAAREKAEAMAAALGQNIGQPTSIIETGSNWWSGYGAWWGARWGGGMTQNVVQDVGGGALLQDGSLAPGQLAINATVSVTFELLPRPTK